MKHKVFAFALALATLMVLLLPLMPPHHHHNGTVCNVLEHCTKDHVTNDIHTRHHGDTSTCVEEAEYIAPRVGCQRTVVAPVQLLPLLTSFLAPLVALLLAAHLRTTRYGRRCVLRYVSPPLTVFALRAPPAVLL